MLKLLKFQLPVIWKKFKRIMMMMMIIIIIIIIIHEIQDFMTTMQFSQGKVDTSHY
jgi:hypothetical protein